MSLPNRFGERNPVLEAALDYSQRGWLVIPIYPPADGRCTCDKGAKCQHPGKHPRTKNGLKDGTTDATAISGWLSKTPDTNLAVVTGAKSGVWVLDVDDAEAAALLTKLARRHGALPRTPTVRTSRGCHYYFQWTTGINVTNKTKLGMVQRRVTPQEVSRSGAQLAKAPETRRSGVSKAYRP